MKKIIRHFVISGILLASISGAVVFLFSSETVLRGVIRITEKIIPGELTVEKTTGQLADFTLLGINYKNTAINLTVRQFQLDWSVSHWLAGFFSINHLKLDGIKIQTFAEPKPAKISGKQIRAWLDRWQWLEHIRCHDVHITDVVWQTLDEKKSFKIDDFIFQLQEGGRLNSELRALNASLLIKGEVGEQINLTWRFNLSRLENFTASRGSISSEGVVSGSSAKPKISGEITANHLVVDSISIGQFKGKLNLNGKQQHSDLSFSLQQFKMGVIEIPSWQGTWLLQIDDGIKLTLAAAPLRVRSFFGEQLLDLQLQLTHHSTGLSGSGSMRSGGGELQFKGEAKINGTTTFNLDVSGKDFLLSNTPEYLITVTPKLHLYFQNNELHIAGDILLPKAAIKIADLNSDTALPREVVFVDQGVRHDILEDLKLYSQVRLTLGNEVKIDAFSIKGLLHGTLEITDEPNRPTTANGALTITQGTYNIYGQGLDITQGELHFAASSVTNPELNMRAVRKLTVVNLPDTMGFAQKNELLVGLQTSGTVDNLQVNLFSVPSGISKTDIFSYLVLGQPAAQASNNKTQLLLQAANALNFSGVSELNHVIGNLREHLGLSELGLTNEATSQVKSDGTVAEPTSNTALVLGKYLSSRLYVSYSIGFLEQLNIFRVRYSLGRRWSVQSENSTLGNGVDLIYSVERN